MLDVKYRAMEKKKPAANICLVCVYFIGVWENESICIFPGIHDLQMGLKG